MKRMNIMGTAFMALALTAFSCNGAGTGNNNQETDSLATEQQDSATSVTIYLDSLDSMLAPDQIEGITEYQIRDVNFDGLNELLFKNESISENIVIGVQYGAEVCLLAACNVLTPYGYAPGYDAITSSISADEEGHTVVEESFSKHEGNGRLLEGFHLFTDMRGDGPDKHEYYLDDEEVTEEEYNKKAPKEDDILWVHQINDGWKPLPADRKITVPNMMR